MERIPLSANEAQAKLRKLADPAVASGAVRFFKKEHAENDVFLGLRTPALRQLAKEFQELRLTEVERLLHSSVHEERALALLILCLHVHRASDDTRKEGYDFYLANTQYVNNWDLVDLSARPLVGAYLLHQSRTPLYHLAKSSSLWERRIAIVATHHFIGQKDFTDTFKIAGMLLGDEEDLIHKAVGWMLREVGKRDRPALENFLEKHATVMPRTMLRYAIERFPNMDRLAYLKGTVAKGDR